VPRAGNLGQVVSGRTQASGTALAIEARVTITRDTAPIHERVSFARLRYANCG
jgi:hypothetical protein